MRAQSTGSGVTMGCVGHVPGPAIPRTHCAAPLRGAQHGSPAVSCPALWWQHLCIEPSEACKWGRALG